jgi:hypothetical protein
MGSYPILITIPGVGKDLLYDSPESAADVLANPSKYGLNIKPIYLNIK